MWKKQEKELYCAAIHQKSTWTVNKYMNLSTDLWYLNFHVMKLFSSAPQHLWIKCSFYSVTFLSYFFILTQKWSPFAMCRLFCQRRWLRWWSGPPSVRSSGWMEISFGALSKLLPEITRWWSCLQLYSHRDSVGSAGMIQTPNCFIFILIFELNCFHPFFSDKLMRNFRCWLTPGVTPPPLLTKSSLHLSILMKDQTSFRWWDIALLTDHYLYKLCKNTSQPFPGYVSRLSNSNKICLW